jgi:serine/threonine-protein kinase HipA
VAVTPLFDVYVKERLVGALGPRDGGAFVFTYLPDVPADCLVSLTMPVRLQSYVWTRGLHPFFLMNLPEGYQKDLLRMKLGPHAEVTDAGMLALTGNKTIGRVRVLPKGQPLADVGDDLQMATLLASPGSRERLLQYLEAGVTEGISGVMPKTLAMKTTAAVGDYIVKTGRPDLPGLAINEYLCLEVVRKTGLHVPQTTLSQDGDVLAIMRFDRTETGEWLGVEDFCALKGLDPVSKYRGSLEEIAKLLSIYVPQNRLTESALRLYKLLLLNYALRNADAHLKNFALTYTSAADVTLAPVYDVVTVIAYPEYKNDLPGLTISGKKVWRSGKLIHQYGAVRLSLTAPQMAAGVEEVCTAIAESVPLVSQFAEAYPAFREIGKRMLTAWEIGMLDIKPTVAAEARAGNQLRTLAGLSDEMPQPKKKKKNPYRSADGAFSHKAR